MQHGELGKLEKSHEVRAADTIVMEAILAEKSIRVGALHTMQAVEGSSRAFVSSFSKPSIEPGNYRNTGGAGSGALYHNRVQRVHASIRGWPVDCEGAEERQASRNV